MKLYLLGLLVCSACSSPIPEVQAQNKPCLREYAIGSNIPTLNCSPQKTDMERQQMIEEVRTNRQANPSGAGKGSGS